MTKFVTLKDLPFAPANTVFAPNGFTQIGNNLFFKAGKYKYNLIFGTDVRRFAEDKDSSLPISNLPKSIGDVTSDIGSYALMGWLIYKGYKQGKGVGYYIGYGLLGWIGGGIAGRIVGNLFATDYTGKKEAISKGTSLSNKGDDNVLINKAATNISSWSKSGGNNISANEYKSKLTAVSKNYSPIEKDIFNSLMNIFSVTSPESIKNPMAMFSKIQEVFAPMADKYSEEDVQKAGTKVMGDLKDILPKDIFKANS